MFARFHATSSRLKVSLRESRRHDGHVHSENIASLGAIALPMTVGDRVAFWAALHERLANLANRISGDDHAKIMGAAHTRIPMVTPDEQRELQRENAEADARFWEGLQGMDAHLATGHKEIAVKAARIAADAEKRAMEAASNVMKAKGRLDKLAKGETVQGGLGKPMMREQMEKILKDNGWTDADRRFLVELASLREDEFEASCRRI